MIVLSTIGFYFYAGFLTGEVFFLELVCGVVRYFFKAAGYALTGLVEGLGFAGLVVFLAGVAVIGRFVTVLAGRALTIDTLEATGFFAVTGLVFIS